MPGTEEEYEAKTNDPDDVSVVVDSQMLSTEQGKEVLVVDSPMVATVAGDVEMGRPRQMGTPIGRSRTQTIGIGKTDRKTASERIEKYFKEQLDELHESANSSCCSCCMPRLLRLLRDILVWSCESHCGVRLLLQAAALAGWWMNSAWYSFGLEGIRETSLAKGSQIALAVLFGVGGVWMQLVLVATFRYVTRYLPQALQLLTIIDHKHGDTIRKLSRESRTDMIGGGCSGTCVKESCFVRSLRRIDVRVVTAVVAFGIWVTLLFIEWRRFVNYLDKDRSDAAWVTYYLVATCFFQTLSLTLLMFVFGCFGLMIWLIRKPFSTLSVLIKGITNEQRLRRRDAPTPIPSPDECAHADTAGPHPSPLPRGDETEREDSQTPKASELKQGTNWKTRGIRRQYHLANNGAGDFAKTWSLVVGTGGLMIFTMMLIFGGLFDVLLHEEDYMLTVRHPRYMVASAVTLAYIMCTLANPSSYMQRTKRLILRVIEEDNEEQKGLHELKLIAIAMPDGLKFGQFQFTYDSVTQRLYIVGAFLLFIFEHSGNIMGELEAHVLDTSH